MMIPHKQTVPFHLKNLNIKQKLLLSYFILIIIPLGFLTIVSYTVSSSILNRNIIDSSERIMEQTGKILQYRMDNALEAIDIVAFNDNIRSILSRNSENYTMYQQLNDLRTLQAILLNVQSGKKLYRIKLYVPNGRVYSNQNENIFNLKSIMNTKLYREAEARAGGIYLTPARGFYYQGEGEKRIIAATSVIKDIDDIYKAVGMVSVDILEQDVVEILRNARLTPGSMVYIVDTNGQIITTSGGGNPPVYHDLAWFRRLQQSSQRSIDVQSNGRKYIISYNRLANINWDLISVIPLDEILKPNLRLRNYIFLMMIVIGAMAYLVAIYITYNNTKRIRNFIQMMKKVRDGDLSVTISRDSADEIGDMEESFNFMIHRLELLLKERYQMGQDIKNIELKALQEQINPHFLYNTLDLINWSAEAGQKEDVKTIVNALAKFYKISLSKGKNVISIAEELEHAKAYLSIQNRRYQDKLDLEINVSEEILEYSILKITLQPLLENAIIHGILAKPEKSGKIIISGQRVDDDILLSVADDGVGMSEITITRILNESSSQNHGGYGVKNVHDRLRLHYGEKYGLFYRSEPGRGTVVEIRLPVVK